MTELHEICEQFLNAPRLDEAEIRADERERLFACLCWGCRDKIPVSEAPGSKSWIHVPAEGRSFLCSVGAARAYREAQEGGK